ncbi:CalY family protein [Candidatus Saccharibacteria bacterium]|nr:CalY family protein [Candidatus Saccharibacteria bacterium]
MPQQYEKREDRKKNNKLIVALVLIFGAVAIVTGVMFAFFSDVILGSGTATSGTLDLRGTFQYQVNGGTSTPMTTAIANLNPGDAVYISATVTNVGNKSAYVRSAFEGAVIDSALKPYMYVFSGNVAQATLLTAENGAVGNPAKDIALCALSGYVAGGNGGTGCSAFAGSGSTGVGTVGILNGTGAGAETEGSGVSSFPAGFTVYFAYYAPNTAQGKSLAIGARVEGLQFRNMSSAPTLNDAIWGSAVSTIGVNDL